MIVLGLILIVLAVAAGALLFIGTQPLTEPVELETPWVQASALPLALLIAGAAVMLLLWLGLVMIRGSIRRKTRRRRETKELERQAEAEAQARREAESRREAEARTAPAPVPAARFADTRDRPGDGWHEDPRSTDRGDTRVIDTRTDTPDDSRGDSRLDARADARTDETRVDDGSEAPTRADHLMGRDKHESHS